MQILSVDIGTGTQDVFLYDLRLNIENGFKLVVPSPTMIVNRRIKEVTRKSEPILLTGVTMGGGPSHWAVEDHLKAGLKVYATPGAARSFNDDLDYIAETGIEVVSEDEAIGLEASTECFELKDFDFHALRNAFVQFGVSMDALSLVTAAVFDHGAAPPNYSDRKFRFEYIESRIREHNRLSAFAYPADKVPAIMTRMQSVVHSASDLDVPLMLMDTAPAAVMGALLDPRVRAPKDVLIANVGNFHTLAFRLDDDGISGVFEHHTGFMSTEKLDRLLIALADGSLKDEDVFDDHGHGARVIKSEGMILNREDFGVVVVGPRRSILQNSQLQPYFAAPFGDMMLVGCFGMLAAAAEVYPDLRESLHQGLLPQVDAGVTPWDI